MKRSLGFLIALLLMVVIYFCYHRKSNNYKNVILRNPCVTTCILKNISFVNKRGYQLEYSFDINGNTYNSKSYRSKFSLNKAFAGKSFPLIYAKEEFEKHEILITPDNFKEYDIAFPDSLNWVLQYVK